MLLNCILLALSVSIDSLGIGITYGIKNTKISLIGKIILFIIHYHVVWKTFINLFYYLLKILLKSILVYL